MLDLIKKTIQDALNAFLKKRVAVSKPEKKSVIFEQPETLNIHILLSNVQKKIKELNRVAKNS